METKIIAAELATGAGVTTVILNSKNIASVFPIVAMAGGARADGAPAPAEDVWTEEDEARLPAHTRFVPMENPLNECASCSVALKSRSD
jgi:glutamate 5-kinase